MLCPHSKWLSDEAFLSQMNERAALGGVPISGGMDLTSRCNLSCRHCYIHAADGGGSADIDEDAACRILDEAAEAGCLFFLMTGGEPLLHPGFARIYRHAKDLGMFVTVFTNGTLVDDEIIALFSDYTPMGVEVSIYGATPEVHDSVTGVVGSHEKTLCGVKRLKASGINVSLKTMVMTLNEQEFAAMRQLADDLDVGFRMDAALFPTLSGNCGPIELRVSPRRAIECEFELPDRAAKWADFLEKMGDVQTDGSLYVCGAGRTAFHITERCILRPCLMVSHIGSNLMEKSFSQAWAEMSAVISALRASPDNPCVNCENSVLCDACPGFFMLENGDENKRSNYLCELADGRANIVRAFAGT